MLAGETTAQTASCTRWLSIVGVGEDGLAGLSANARDLIRSARFVFGAERHLELVAPLIQGSARRWPHPFDPSFAEILAQRGTPVCVLASGDPLHYGAGASLSRLVAAGEAVTVPALSAFTLAAARLNWPLAEVTLLSFCGRPIETIRPHLQPRARLLALSADQHTPAHLAQLLRELGFGGTRITVLEALGGQRERVRMTTAEGFGLTDIGSLNTLALEIEACAEAKVLPRAGGLPDHYFEHDGQLTRREARALTLSALAPRRGQLLWDVGAGAGSIGIEWMLSDSSLKALAIECSPERAARIARNARALGVPDLNIITGRAPEALAGLPEPDAVFLGGGVSTAGLIEAAQTALVSGGRLVANAVSLESELRLLQVHRHHGGSLTRIALSRAEPLGKSHRSSEVMGWRASMPLTQWTWIKP